ncbi:MAG: NAD(P)-dependent oxidoreductase [Actinomycetaceae bacterium]|nr:NAD(P)-dependent oxidoreductase [Actinomycetaceae bacterium]MDY5855281.1 NAD(P)-dependent oxidoreductase [Arcanobacterium sp.]
MKPQHLLITESFFTDMIPALNAALAKADIPMSVRLRADGSASSDDYQWADSWLGFQAPRPALHPTIRWFHSASDGVNQFLPLREEIATHQVLLTNTVGTMPERIAEFCVAAILGHIVGLPRYRAYQDAGEYRRHPNPTALGRKLTVIGTGRIGSMIAQRLRPFLEGAADRIAESSGARALGGTADRDGATSPAESLVRGLSLSGREKPEFDAVAPLASGRYLSDADILVVILPDTPQSKNIVNAQVLHALQGAIVVNVGRGSTLDSAALRTAIESGSVSHAILDVFETEPLPADDWRWHHPAVTLTPHVSGYTFFSDVIDDFIANLRALYAGQTPPHTVTLSQGY